jgi:putative redox protein
MSTTSIHPREPDASAESPGGSSRDAEPRPTTTTVQASWRGERRYDIRRPGGPALTIDASGAVGPGPVDTMLGALAACCAIDVVDYLAKRRTPVESLDIRIDAERRATPPRRVLQARLEFQIAGGSIELPHAERAIALSIQSYCSVSASLAPDLRIETVLVLNGAAQSVVTHRVAA